MRLALHLRLAIPALIGCMLFSGKAFDLIQLPPLALTILLAALAFKLPRYRQGIETAFGLGLPLICAFGAAAESSLQVAGAYLAFGLCGSVYGLLWFGLDPSSNDPAWRRWTTVAPVVGLVGLLFPMSYDGPGMGLKWVVLVALATCTVVVVAGWRWSAPSSATWSFAAAATLCLGVHAFQNLGQANTLDIALVFVPYVTGIVSYFTMPRTRSQLASSFDHSDSASSSFARPTP